MSTCKVEEALTFALFGNVPVSVAAPVALITTVKAPVTPASGGASVHPPASAVAASAYVPARAAATSWAAASDAYALRCAVPVRFFTAPCVPAAVSASAFQAASASTLTESDSPLAVSVAAAMFEKLPLEGKKVISLISGGNIDVTILNRVIERGLMKTGRCCTLKLELIDKPGQLKDVSRIIADCGGNVTEVHHEHAFSTESVNGCYLRIKMETVNYDQVNAIREALKAEGFKIV